MHFVISILCVIQNFQIQFGFFVPALHIDARISLIHFLYLFQFKPDLVILALHIGARISLIYSRVVFQIRPITLCWNCMMLAFCWPIPAPCLGYSLIALALHIDARICKPIPVSYFKYSLTALYR
jgi:hypothetical protein